mgnify:CR=1 FL=1
MPEKSRWLLLRIPEEDCDDHYYVAVLELSGGGRQGCYERRARAAAQMYEKDRSLMYMEYSTWISVRKIDYSDDDAVELYESLFSPGFSVVDELPPCLPDAEARLDGVRQVIFTLKPYASYWEVTLKHEDASRGTTCVDFKDLFPVSAEPEENPPWLDNELQFARLIAEIAATVDTDIAGPLSESMDLSLDELNELFERANTVWETAKAKLTRPITR